MAIFTIYPTGLAGDVAAMQAAINAASDGDTIQVKARKLADLPSGPITAWKVGEASGWTRAAGSVTCVAGSLIPEGGKIEFTVPWFPGENTGSFAKPTNKITVQFTKVGGGSLVPAGRNPCFITNAHTAIQVADRLRTVLNNRNSLGQPRRNGLAVTASGPIQATNGGANTNATGNTATVALKQCRTGADGNLPITLDAALISAGLTKVDFAGGTSGAAMPVVGPDGTFDLIGDFMRSSLGDGSDALPLNINKAVTLLGDVDGGGLPETLFEQSNFNRLPAEQPFGYWQTPYYLDSLFTRSDMRITNGFRVHFDGYNASLNKRARLENIKIIPTGFADVNEALSAYGAFVPSKPFEIVNCELGRYTQTIWPIMSAKSVYPNLTSFGLANPDLSDGIRSTIHKLTLRQTNWFSHGGTPTETTVSELKAYLKPTLSIFNRFVFGVRGGVGYGPSNPYGTQDVIQFTTGMVMGPIRYMTNTRIEDCELVNDVGGQAWHSFGYVDGTAANTGFIRNKFSSAANSVHGAAIDLYAFGPPGEEMTGALAIDNEWTGLDLGKSVGVRLWGVEQSPGNYTPNRGATVTGNRDINTLTPTQPSIALFDLVVESGSIKNDFTDSQQLTLNAGGPGVVYLGPLTYGNTVMESGSFPVGQGGAKNHVLDLGMNNRIVGESAKNVGVPKTPRGIGGWMKASTEADDAE